MAGFNHNNSSLRVCVDRIQGQTVGGRVYSRRLTEPLAFSDMSGLALRLEDVFDRQRFPQAFLRSRTFLPGETEEGIAAAEPSQGMSDEMVLAQRGELATFEVLVISRRNASWQGFVEWTDSGERQKFASFLELLRLLKQRFQEYSR